MSADSVLARRLGDDFDATVGVQTRLVAGQNRYSRADTEIVVDLENLSEAEQEQLIELVHRAVEKGCTVGRTIDQGMQQELHVTSEG